MRTGFILMGNCQKRAKAEGWGNGGQITIQDIQLAEANSSQYEIVL
jgi:hypothetical protein